MNKHIANIILVTIVMASACVTVFYSGRIGVSN